MALSDYSQQYRRLLEEVGSFLGFGEVLEEYSAQDMRLIARAVDHGIVDFCNPIDPRTGMPYQWTFNTKEIEVILASGDYLIELPLAVSDAIGSLTPRNTTGDNPRTNPIPRVPLADVRARLDSPAAHTFAPSCYAFVDSTMLVENTPVPDLSTTSHPLGAGRFTLVFDHVADATYTYTLQCKLNPERLRYAETDWYGGPSMWPFVLNSVLCQAELKVDGESGVNCQQRDIETIKAITIDAARRPEFLGYMGDGSYGSGSRSIGATRDAIRYFGGN